MKHKKKTSSSRFDLCIINNKQQQTRIMKGLTFSLKRAVGISGLKTKVARKTGIPTTKLGAERKVGGAFLGVVFGKKKSK